MQTDAPSSTPARPPSLWPFFVLGLALLLLFYFVNKLLVGSGTGNTDPEEAARAELRIKNLAEVRAEAEKKLTTYAWVDRAKGSVQIPIAQAMDMVIPALNESKPRPAYPVTPPPAPSSAPEAPSAPKASADAPANSVPSMP